MRTPPWSPRLLAFILVGISLSFPIQILYLYDYQLSEWPQVLDKLTSINWLTMSACTVTALSLWNCSQSCIKLIAVTALIMIWNNYLVGFVAYNYTLIDSFIASGLFLFSYSLLLHPKALLILRHPERRWWLQAERKNIQINMQIASLHGLDYSLKTFDISKTGAFLSLNEKQALADFNVGDYCDIRLQLSEYKRLRCRARVVRLSHGYGQYPPGIGLEFKNLPGTEARYLKGILNQPAEVTH